MDIDDSLESVINDINKKYVDMKIKDALEIIIKLLNNLLKNPNEQKFRIFKKSNEIIKSKVLKMKEFLTLMSVIGYTDLDQDAMMFLDDSNLPKLHKAVDVINKHLKILNVKWQEKEKQEEIIKQDEIKKYNEENKRKFLEEKEKQKKILAQMEYDKEERKKMEKPKDSIGKKLNFGANVCKFEPKNGGGGGGG